jgi:type II secretory pathway pseudopilin PulG
MKISQIAFSLVELIVVISIMVLLTTSSVFYFFDFSDRRELIVHIELLKNRIADLDLQVKNFEISDYSMTFTGWYDYAVGNKNTLWVEYPLQVALTSPFEAELSVQNGDPDSTWKYSILSQGKEVFSQVSAADTIQTYSLTSGQEYEIYGYVDGRPSNTFFIYTVGNLDAWIELESWVSGSLYNRNNITSSHPAPLELIFTKSWKQQTLTLP